MDTLSGKHAVVTGASRGIGLAIARSLAEQGARVTLMARDAAALEAAAGQLGAAAAWQLADVADQASVAAAFERAGTVDILVNNAGQASSSPFLRTDEALWQGMLEVNLTGAYRCIQAALPSMLEARWGRIVNVASTAGLTGYRYVAAYCAAKHGLVGLTRALALELATKGITVNAVCPGYTETDIVREAIANIVRKTGRTEAQARAELAAANPQGRLVQPEEVAHAVTMLCMPAAAAMNGQAIAVAGGEVL
ncbi:3-hydroxyacyl-CoA dehydrogenase [Massilia sp. WF1]|uniref:SDR family NAD(P)-dependent oxidoreductase n=1 Tax=unclassified Massilia TaxID=2609279 RepID=UPI00064A9C17|nr:MULTISPECIES: SDR family NAD(P)-dependent oxidoreductase [unclassified Massilia]ALK96935.1 3-hydroxyacyl-CoA dehydrogenase [Massilia sp. WG5]KLU38001.1 3-hydroxyacyl-CoA dehydrogenase [Massilia sp. WF1]